MSATTTDEKRAKRDTKDPCIKCGWSKHMGIHQPRVCGYQWRPPICTYERGLASQPDTEKK